jgi:hypothetical protein
MALRLPLVETLWARPPGHHDSQWHCMPVVAGVVFQ